MPGGTEIRMADSRLSLGARPVFWMAVSWVSRQLLFETIVAPLPSCSSRNGSASGSGTPKVPSDGPIPRRTSWDGSSPVIMRPPIMTLSLVRTKPRRRMRLFPSPSMMKPAMRTLSPASTRIRVEIFARWELGVGVAVGMGVGVGVAGGVAVAVALAVAVAVAVGVAVAAGVAIGVAVGVAVAVAVGVPVGVEVGVGVGV